MRRFFFFLSLFGCALLLLAQQHQYSGRLVDAETGEAMPYANLYVSSGHGTLTNLDGQYVIEAMPDEQVRISYVGYATQMFTAGRLPALLKMQPLTSSLNEVTVLGTDALLMKVKEQLRRDYAKYQRRQSHYFCRMTFQKGEQTEMVEAFLEAQSAVNLRSLGVTNGQYWAKAPLGRVQSELRNTNMHINYMLGPMMRGDVAWRDILVIPFPDIGAGEKHIHDYYEVSQTTLSGKDDRTIFAITLTPKSRKSSAPIMGGTLYVDAETLHLLRFDASIYNVHARATYGKTKENTSVDIVVKIAYRHKNGYTEVEDISCSAINDDVEVHMMLTNVEDYHLPLTYGEQIGRNILTAIERAGCNPEVEGKYTFIQRTDQETAVAQDVDAEGEDDFSAQRQQDDGEVLLPQLEQLGDTTGVLSYIRRVMRFGQACPQEKVYLHLDNTGYFKGETIWFKAYVTRTDAESRTDLSKILYVELLNPTGDVVERRKLPISNGEAYGDIKVDSIMTTGFYELRAYTRNMINWGTQACYSRVVPIFRAPQQRGNYEHPTIDKIAYRKRLNDERQTSADVVNPNIVELDGTEPLANTHQEGTGAFRVKFYPEGGALVDGLPSRVAFSALDKSGNPVAVSGYLTDKNGSRLGEVQTEREGRGLFSVPAGGQATRVVLHVADGKERSFDLPASQPEGCTMKLNVMQHDQLEADIYCSALVQGTKVGYVMMHGGKIIRCDTLTARQIHRLSFRRKYLPEGVSQLTLFDAEGRILAERLFFIQQTASADDSIHVTSVNGHVAPCGKVMFDIQSRPNATLSFSAVDAAGMVNGNYGNMRTWLLLGSELKGYIAHPEYNLESDDEEHRRATDLLMLVQGWRRYDWQLMSGRATFSKRQPVEDRLLLYGNVKAGKKKLDVDGVDVTAYFFNRQGQAFNATTTTTELGQYGFALPNIAGEWTLQLKAKKNDVPEQYVVGIDRNFSPAARFLSEQETQMLPVDEERAFRWEIPAEDTAKWVSITKKNIVLQNVTVKAKRRVWNRTGWNDETNARYRSLIYYNCDEAADQIADEGETDPLLCDWLKTKNSFFGGESAPQNILLGIYLKDGTAATHQMVDWSEYLACNPTAPPYDQDPPSNYLRVYSDGLLYKGRPIVWVVDNQFCTITDFHFRGRRSGEQLYATMDMNVRYNSNPANTNIDLPLWLEEVKSIYISEETEGLHEYIHCDEIDRQNPVIVYCYTHRRFQQKEKGTRYTHFQGFNVPSTFQMEDYSVVPPMEDFRRTIYWNPNVRLDRRGKATVEFYNNSSCTEMFISAEGMTQGGKPLEAY